MAVHSVSRRFRLRHVLLLVAAIAVVAVAADADQQKTEVDVAPTTERDSTSSQDVAPSVPEFVATDEWQELLPGQGVPKGLHVRLNLETGKREAKLVDPSEAAEEEAMRSVVIDPKKEKTVTVSTDISGDVEVVQEDDVLTTEEELVDEEPSAEDATGDASAKAGAEPNWNHEKIYETLQALPEPPKVEGMDIYDAREKLPPAEFRKQIIALWKKRQAELKEALESLQDDAKYMGKLMEQFKDAEQRGDLEGQLSVLEVLEWEVQDLDKTHIFNFIGGFGIMADYLNSTNLPVRASAAWVFGSAAKNYKDGQDWAIDAGAVPKLTSSLALEIPSDETTAKEVLDVKKKSLYALASMVRSNARGQRLFTLHNGPELLAGLFNDAHPDKLQLKALLFVYDILAEDAETEPAESELTPVMELQALFRSPEWCRRTSKFFVKTAADLVEREVIELVDAMRHQLPECQDVHREADVAAVVESLAAKFTGDETIEDEDKQELSLFFQDFLGRLARTKSTT